MERHEILEALTELKLYGISRLPSFSYRHLLWPSGL